MCNHTTLTTTCATPNCNTTFTSTQLHTTCPRAGLRPCISNLSLRVIQRDPKHVRSLNKTCEGCRIDLDKTLRDAEN